MCKISCTLHVTKFTRLWGRREMQKIKKSELMLGSGWLFSGCCQGHRKVYTAMAASAADSFITFSAHQTQPLAKPNPFLRPSFELFTNVTRSDCPTSKRNGFHNSLTRIAGWLQKQLKQYCDCVVGCECVVLCLAEWVSGQSCDGLAEESGSLKTIPFYSYSWYHHLVAGHVPL